MADDLKAKLDEYGMPGILDILKEPGVGIEELSYLTESDLDKLFNKPDQLGIKAKFRMKLKLIKNQNCRLDSPIRYTEKVEDWILCSKQLNAENININDVLLKTPAGRNVLEYYNIYKTLAPSHHQIVVNTVMDHCLAMNSRLHLHDIEGIRNAVCKHFVGENPDTY